MKLSEVLEHVKDINTQIVLAETLHQNGGWRGLFDPHADEWKRRTLGQKLELLLKIVQTTQVPLAVIVRAYQEEYALKGRSDIAAATDAGLAKLLEAALMMMEKVAK